MAGGSLMAGYFSTSSFPNNSPSRDELINLWKISGEVALEYADAMPEKYYHFRPGDSGELYSYGGQMQHIAENIVRLLDQYITDMAPPELPLENESDKAAIRKNIQSSTDYGTEAIRSLDRHELMETVDFFAGPLPRWHVLFIAQDHTAHHIGQSVIYLRVCGVSPPRWRKWPAN